MDSLYIGAMLKADHCAECARKSSCVEICNAVATDVSRKTIGRRKRVYIVYEAELYPSDHRAFGNFLYACSDAE
jgi:epoxyqueuosine reductase QueG